jgi:hypothetical protein
MYQRQVAGIIKGFEWYQRRVQAVKAIQIDGASEVAGCGYGDGVAMCVIIRVSVRYQGIEAIGGAALEDAYQDVTVCRQRKTHAYLLSKLEVG